MVPSPHPLIKTIMTFSKSDINQGSSNSYKSFSASDLDRVKKIENSYRYSERLSIDMSRIVEHTNISFSSDDEEECVSVYSDADTDCIGDRLSEFDDEAAADQEVYKIKVSIETEEKQEKDARILLQTPSNMKFILPPRPLPSDEEMYREWLAVLAEDSRVKAIRWAVRIISVWWSNILEQRAKRKAHARKIALVQELVSWQRVRSALVGIRTLKPLVSFEDSLYKMNMMKSFHAAIKAGIDERLRMFKVNSDYKVKAALARTAVQKANKERALAKIGMNKNSLWHKERAADSLAFKTATVTASAPGQGKRAQRKLRIEKERKEAEKKAASSPPVVEKETYNSISIVLHNVEENDEEKAAREAEEASEAAELARVSLILLEKQDEKEAADKIAAEQKAADDDFVAFMTDRMKTTTKKKVTVPKTSSKPVIVLGFKTLKQQVIERRMKTDEKFTARSEGFSDLSSKKKLEEVLKYTSLCRSVTEKKKCYHKNCRFAHSLDQLQQKNCRFGNGCSFVQKMENGQYTNKKFGKTGKTCDCMHPGEHKRGFSIRMGLEYTPSEGENVLCPVVSPVISPVVETVISPVLVQINHTDKPDTIVSVVEEKKSEAKADMTKPWAAVVMDSLTPEQKLVIYGKGATILGHVEENRDNVPLAPSTIRSPHDKRGLGLDKSMSFMGVPDRAKLNVKALGFSWVKGAVLQPDAQPTPQPTRIILDPMIKVREAVLAIDKRIAEYEEAKSKAMDIDIANRVALAKSKAADINKYLSVVKESVDNFYIEKHDSLIDMDSRLECAKAKAIEINSRLEKQERRRSERADRKAGWKKVEGSHRQKNEQIIEQPIVIRVPKKDAEIALLGAIRNRLTNFRIEYTD